MHPNDMHTDDMHSKDTHQKASRGEATSETAADSYKLRWPAVAAVSAAVLLPLTAFAGIGAWAGVHKVMLGSAIEVSTSAAAENTAARPRTTEESRSTLRGSDNKPGFLGVSTTGLSGQLRRHFGIPKEVGVLVSNVTDDSAAYQAGLQAGDVITRINATTIEDGSDLRRAIRRAGADSQVTIEVYRDGRPLDFSATLGAIENQNRSYSYSWSSDDDDNDWSGNRRNFSWSEDEIEDFTERMEEFGERMEAWGEEFGRRMEERFENGNWDKNSFHFRRSGAWDSDTWDVEEFEEAMEHLNLELENLNLDEIGEIVRGAMETIDFDSINETVADAVERAMRALDQHNNYRE